MGGSRDMSNANGVTRHFSPEPFAAFAARELADCPPWERGVCFNPDCGCRFKPIRDWQIYCSKACERTGLNELRKWGHRAALPLLCHRLGKYETSHEGLRALSNAGRCYVGRLQSAWVLDRAARKGGVRS